MKIAVRSFLLLLTSFSLEAKSNELSVFSENGANHRTQSAAVLTLGTATITVGPAAGTASVTLIGSPPTQISATASWLHVSGPSTTQLQTFTYDANAGATRNGTITFNNGALTLTVTQAGTGYTRASEGRMFSSAGMGVAVDKAGSVYIADPDNYAIVKWHPATQQTTTLISGLYGTPPSDIAVDKSGNVYISAWTVGLIGQWSPSSPNIVTWLVSSGLVAPTSLAVDPSGNIYIADAGDNAIKVWSSSTQTLSTLIPSVNSAMTVAVDGNGNVYFGDGTAIKKWDTVTKQVTTLATFNYSSYGVAVDGSGNVYTCTSGWGIQEWNVITQQATAFAGLRPVITSPRTAQAICTLPAAVCGCCRPRSSTQPLSGRRKGIREALPGW